MRGGAATLAAGALLALFGWMAASVSHVHSPTADELLHVTAGYSYWTTGDFRLHPENGNLPQRWAALPLLAMDVRFPPLDQPAWRAAHAPELGYQFFYEQGNHPTRLLAAARLMIVLLGIAGGALVFLWARSLFGVQGALLALTLYAFCPNLLAHGGLATSDMAATLFFLAAVLTGWRLLHRVTWGRLAAAGLAAGGLALSKFSAPLLVPMLGLMALARALRGAALPVRLGRRTVRRRGLRAAGALGAAFGAAALLALVVVWAGYGFRYAALDPDEQPGSFHQSWSTVLMEQTVVPDPRFVVHASEQELARIRPGILQAAVRAARDLHLLPEAWIYGLAHVARFSLWRVAFFMGEFRGSGWPSYFPLAFLLKTTLPALGLAVLAAGAWWRQGAGRRRTRALYRLIPIGTLIAVYGAFALTLHLNIGHRHILPLYPAFYLLCGAAALGFRRTWWLILVVTLAIGHAAASLAIRPHYLAYFNPLLGGPAQAYRYFVDSSLDWGQDLPGLRRWLDAHAGGERVFLSYFGAGSPAYEGIRATRIADNYFDLRAREVAPPLTGGIYCISATMFQQVYTLVRHGWTLEHERRYTEARRWYEAWRSGHDATPREEAIPRMIDLEHLRFGRLCAGLRARAPDDQIGYSILIFRLSDADVRLLLDGPPPFTG